MTRLLAGVVAAFALVAVTVSATSQTPGPRPVAGTGLISGKVVEAGTQIPVEAVVTLFDSDRGRRRVMADEQGRYVFTGVAPGTYHVVTAQFGYLGGAFGKLRPAGEWLDIDLADGQRVTDANVSMWKLVSISGRILDEAREPVVGVNVRPFRREVRRGQIVLEPSFDGYRWVTTVVCIGQRCCRLATMRSLCRPASAHFRSRSCATFWSPALSSASPKLLRWVTPAI